MRKHWPNSSLFHARWFQLITLAALCIAVGWLVAHLPDHILATPTKMASWLVSAGLAIIAWPTLRRRSIVGLVLVYGFLGFGILAAFLYQPTSAEFHGPNLAVARLARETDGSDYLTIFLIVALVTWLVILTITSLFRHPHDRLLTTVTLDLSSKILPLTAIPLLLNIYGTGVFTIIQTSHYLDHSGPIVAVSIGQALAPIAILLCGYFAFRSDQTVITRTIAFLIAIGYETLFFAAGTRFFALWIPLMFAGGYLTGCWSVSRRQIGLLITVLVSVIALQIPLSLRNLPHHGLVPGAGYIINQPSLVFGAHDPVNNLLFGAPLTLFVAHHVEPLPASDIVTAVNPLPSVFNNWSEIKARLRLNIYAPYSALGELLNHGWMVFIALLICIGAAFVLLERLALQGSLVQSGLSQFVVIGAAALFVVQSTEYNLRSVIRLLYYAFIAQMALRVFLGRFQTNVSDQKRHSMKSC